VLDQKISEETSKYNKQKEGCAFWISTFWGTSKNNVNLKNIVMKFKIENKQFKQTVKKLNNYQLI